MLNEKTSQNKKFVTYLATKLAFLLGLFKLIFGLLFTRVGRPFFSVLNVLFFSVLNVLFFSVLNVLFFSILQKECSVLFRSFSNFLHPIKEKRTERKFHSFQKNKKERKNVKFFSKEWMPSPAFYSY